MMLHLAPAIKPTLDISYYLGLVEDLRADHGFSGIFIVIGISLSLPLIVSLVITFLVQSAITFGIVKLLMLGNLLDRYLLEGLIVMSCLPMTISSCTIFTQAASGNEELSVINSLFSNSLGIFICPGLVLLYLGQSSSLDFGKVCVSPLTHTTQPNLIYVPPLPLSLLCECRLSCSSP